MNVERAGKRDRKVQARNYEDRVELERRHKPNHRSHALIHRQNWLVKLQKRT